MDLVELSKQLVLGEILSRWVNRQPTNEALVYKHKRLTYKQLDERVNCLANSLSDLGVEKYDNIGLIFKNCNEIIECYFAIAKLGAVAVPCNFRFREYEYVYQLKQANCRALIFSEEFRNIVTSIRADLPEVEHYICAGKRSSSEFKNYEKLLKKSSTYAPTVYLDDDDPAFIMFTSGTTGKPKGAVLTHKNKIMSAISFARHYPKTNNLLIVFPLFHIAATFELIYGIFHGMTIYVLRSPKPELIIELIANEKIQLVSMVPILWNAIVEHPELYRHDLSSLKVGCTGGAPISVIEKRRIMESLPNMQFLEAFGMTETTAMGTFATHQDNMAKPGSIGKPVNYLDVRIVNENGCDISSGQVGEIICRGPTVMKEYYKDPETTTEAIKKGWFFSGDLASRDADGYIYIMDRKKDLIISGGENIYPAEIENLLAEHPKISETAVIGVPDLKWGESVKAFVVLKPGEELTEIEVIEYCKKKIASYKKPKFVEFVDSLPRTKTGKLLKSKLR